MSIHLQRSFHRGDRTGRVLPPQERKNPSKILWRGGILILALGLVFLAACPKKPRRPPKERPISIPTRPIPPVAPELSPRREASQKIVEMGKNYLEAGDADKAVQTFQEAINVDPENGVAFFFMSLGLYQLQLFDDSLGVLERADTLLSPYSDWRREVERLRGLIEEAKAFGGERAPPEKEGYY